MSHKRSFEKMMSSYNMSSESPKRLKLDYNECDEIVYRPNYIPFYDSDESSDTIVYKPISIIPKKKMIS